MVNGWDLLIEKSKRTNELRIKFIELDILALTASAILYSTSFFVLLLLPLILFIISIGIFVSKFLDVVTFGEIYSIEKIREGASKVLPYKLAWWDKVLIHFKLKQEKDLPKGVISLYQTDPMDRLALLLFYFGIFFFLVIALPLILQCLSHPSMQMCYFNKPSLS